MSYQAGDTYPATVTIRDEAGALTDPTTLTLSVRDDAGVIRDYAYPSSPIVRDDVGTYHADVAFTGAGMWVIQWATSSPAQLEAVQIAVAEVPAYAVTLATLDELALRLGYTPVAAEATMLLELATGLILDAVDRDAEWLSTLTPVPAVLRAVCLEMVARVMQNRASARSESETIGQYQHSVSYTNGASGLALTDAEVILARRTVVGFSSGSARVDSLITELACHIPLWTEL